MILMLGLAGYSQAQCELTGQFQWWQTPNSNFVAMSEDTLVDDCPQADFLGYMWYLNGNLVWDTEYYQGLGLGPGVYELCHTVTAYTSEGIVIQEASSCQTITVDCNLQGFVSVVSATSTEAVVMLNGPFNGGDVTTYMWSTNSGVFSQPNGPTLLIQFPQYPLSGSVLVVDSNGCSATFPFFIQSPDVSCNVELVATVDQNLVTITEYQNGVPVANPNNSNYWSNYYLDGVYLTNDHNPTFYIPEVGTYELCNLVDAANCTTENCISITITEVNNTCETAITVNSNSGGTYYIISTSTFGLDAYEWYVDGEVVGNFNYLWYNFEPGVHTVTFVATNPITGCSAEASIEITVPEPITICGYAFVDTNENGIFDDGELPVEGVGIIENWGVDSVITDINGYYELTVYPGEFSVNGYAYGLPYDFTENIGQWQNSFQTWTATESATECNYNWPMQDFAANICGTAFLDLNQNGVLDAGEPGLSNTVITTWTWNSISPVENFTDMDGNYCFVSPAGYNYLTAVYTTSGGQELTAYATTPTMLPGESYDGINFAFYFVEGGIDVELNFGGASTMTPGFYGFEALYLENNGTEAAVVDVIIQLPTYQLSVVPQPLGGVAGVYNSSANTVTWTGVPIDGLGYLYSYISFYTSTSAVNALGSIVLLSGTATVTNGTDVNESNNSDVVPMTIIGSYDPNNILVYPSQNGFEGQMLPTNDAFTYVINFQNTGNAPAINIRVEDQLEEDLDWSTFEMIGSSHNYSVSMEAGHLIWNFNNIMLPDSTSDEPGSHGQIVYRIKPVADKPVGTLFENTAYIYFDFNDPIITNTATIEFVSEIVSVGEIEKDRLVVYPNPATDVVNISSEMIKGNEMIRIYDLQGRMVYQSQNKSTGVASFHPEVASGQYILEISSDVTRVTQKLVIR
ncbi:MAG: T9SS type A sorting domain-containing protein [Flavobacteriales bacterium]